MARNHLPDHCYRRRAPRTRRHRRPVTEHCMDTRRDIHHPIHHIAHREPHTVVSRA